MIWTTKSITHIKSSIYEKLQVEIKNQKTLCFHCTTPTILLQRLTVIKVELLPWEIMSINKPLWMTLKVCSIKRKWLMISHSVISNQLLQQDQNIRDRIQEEIPKSQNDQVLKELRRSNLRIIFWKEKCQNLIDLEVSPISQSTH